MLLSGAVTLQHCVSQGDALFLQAPVDSVLHKCLLPPLSTQEREALGIPKGKLLGTRKMLKPQFMVIRTKETRPQVQGSKQAENILQH